jgi:hypothetical protein
MRAPMSVAVVTNESRCRGQQRERRGHPWAELCVREEQCRNTVHQPEEGEDIDTQQQRRRPRREGCGPDRSGPHRHCAGQ